MFYLEVGIGLVEKNFSNPLHSLYLSVRKQITYIERQNSLFWRVIGALCFTIATASIVYFFLTMDFSLKEKHFYAHFDLFQITFVSLFIGIYASYTINCYFDFKNNRFKREFTVGLIKFGKWKTMPQLDYISLFAVNQGTFQINLWNNKNQHWDLYEEFNFKDAFTIAFELSEELNIDLLDATEANNYRWIDKEATKLSKEIVYKD